MPCLKMATARSWRPKEMPRYQTQLSGPGAVVAVEEAEAEEAEWTTTRVERMGGVAQVATNAAPKALRKGVTERTV